MFHNLNIDLVFSSDWKIMKMKFYCQFPPNSVWCHSCGFYYDIYFCIQNKKQNIKHIRSEFSNFSVGDSITFKLSNHFYKGLVGQSTRGGFREWSYELNRRLETWGWVSDYNQLLNISLSICQRNFFENVCSIKAGKRTNEWVMVDKLSSATLSCCDNMSHMKW